MRGRVLGLARAAHRWVRAAMIMQRVVPLAVLREYMGPLSAIGPFLRHPLSTARAAAAFRRALPGSGFDMSIYDYGGPLAPLIETVLARLRTEADPVTQADLGGLPDEEQIAELAAALEDIRWRLWQRMGWALAVFRDHGSVRLLHPVRLVAFQRDEPPPKVGEFVMVRLGFQYPRTSDGLTWHGEMLVLRVESQDDDGAVFFGSVQPTSHAARLSGILPGDEILFSAAHIDETTHDLGAWGMSAEGRPLTSSEIDWLRQEGRDFQEQYQSIKAARGDRKRPGQAVSQMDAVAGTIETPADPSRCKEIAGRPGLMPGWGCCQCRTYNGHQREREGCKYCGHVRCDTAPRAN